MQVNSVSNKNSDKRKVKASKGIAAAIATNSIVGLASMPIGISILNKMSKIGKTLNSVEIAKVNNTAEDVLNLTGLAKKGVEILDINKDSIKNFDIGPLENITNPIVTTAKGKNAAYIPKISPNGLGIKPNTIIVNKSKMPTALFHEMGHAFNANKTKFWKGIQNLRGPGMLIAGACALIPAFTKTTKPQDGKELTKKEKFINGLRKSSPFLAIGAMLPTLAEEGMATFRGNKWAKQALDSDLAKKVAKTNKLGFLTYAISVATVGLTAYLTKTVKDKFDKKTN